MRTLGYWILPVKDYVVTEDRKLEIHRLFFTDLQGPPSRPMVGGSVKNKEGLRELPGPSPVDFCISSGSQDLHIPQRGGYILAAHSVFTRNTEHLSEFLEGFAQLDTTSVPYTDAVAALISRFPAQSRLLSAFYLGPRSNFILSSGDKPLCLYLVWYKGVHILYWSPYDPNFVNKAGAREQNRVMEVPLITLRNQSLVLQTLFLETKFNGWMAANGGQTFPAVGALQRYLQRTARHNRGVNG